MSMHIAQSAIRTSGGNYYPQLVILTNSNVRESKLNR